MLFCSGAFFFFLPSPNCEFKSDFPSGSFLQGFPPPQPIGCLHLTLCILLLRRCIRKSALLFLQASCHFQPRHPSTDISTTTISTWIYLGNIQPTGSLMSAHPGPAHNKARLFFFFFLLQRVKQPQTKIHSQEKKSNLPVT